ncbi:MAG: hypothetical protein F4X65_10460 [Chloroflexi bacterium]|nr:hypothetical protein [Chloroflexota bacterium]
MFEEKDAISGTYSIGIGIVATESTLEWPYDNPYLYVSCFGASGDNPLFAIVISWHEYLGNENPEVSWRLNEESASTERWFLVGDDGVRTTEPRQLVLDLLRADKITARVHRDFSDSLTAMWLVEGFAEAYKPVEEACGQ